jgi:hypothetical protein
MGIGSPRLHDTFTRARARVRSTLHVPDDGGPWTTTGTPVAAWDGGFSPRAAVPAAVGVSAPLLQLERPD